jgi:hypothetical protein
VAEQHGDGRSPFELLERCAVAEHEPRLPVDEIVRALGAMTPLRPAHCARVVRGPEATRRPNFVT